MEFNMKTDIITYLFHSNNLSVDEIYSNITEIMIGGVDTVRII